MTAAQDYEIHVGHHLHPLTSYKFPLPGDFVDCTALLIRVKVPNSIAARFFRSFIVVQEGEAEGIDLSQYLVPVEGIPQVFEVMLPWTASGSRNVSVAVHSVAHQGFPPVSHHDHPFAVQAEPIVCSQTLTSPRQFQEPLSSCGHQSIGARSDHSGVAAYPRAISPVPHFAPISYPVFIAIVGFMH